MTGRAKIEAALSTGGSPEPPVVICYEGIYVRDHWDQVTDCPWWYRQSTDLEQQLAWRRDVIERTGQDWFALPGCLPRARREATTIETRPDGVYAVCGTVTEKLSPPVVGGWEPMGASEPADLDQLPSTVKQVDAALRPAEPFDADGFLASGQADLAQAMLAEHGGALYPAGGVSSPLWGCYGLWGFEGMMLMLAERPELVRHACERMLTARIASVQQAAAMGAAGLWIEECMTDMVSPAMFESINVPIMQRLVESINACGLASIYYYCGDPWDRFDALLSIGADALALEEGKKGFSIDIEDVVERTAGRCAVLGNLDAIGVLERGSDAELADEVARQVQAGRRNGGRFVMSIGSPVTPDTPVDRVRQYCDLTRTMNVG